VPAPAQQLDLPEKGPAYDGVIAEIRAHGSCTRER
jgi:hypothetical protein